MSTLPEKISTPPKVIATPTVKCQPGLNPNNSQPHPKKSQPGPQKIANPSRKNVTSIEKI